MSIVATCVTRLLRRQRFQEQIWGLSVGSETAAPCRHPGAPPEEVIELVVGAVRAMSADVAFLQRQGLTVQDFELALPAAIQRIRGSAAASNSIRRNFLVSLFQRMATDGVISDFDVPEYGDDTVYRLHVPTIGSVAIIQKGCPDGAHSSVNWTAPDWANETYLWWLCDSLQYEPGEHVAKGLNRLRNRFFSNDYTDSVDGVIFHNATCASPLRPCPKIATAIDIDGKKVPPPCIWVMPERTALDASAPADWNWEGSRARRFPAILLSAFGIDETATTLYTGYVGFTKGERGTRTTLTSRYGPGRSTIFRSEPR